MSEIAIIDKTQSDIQTGECYRNQELFKESRVIVLLIRMEGMEGTHED